MPAPSWITSWIAEWEHIDTLAEARKRLLHLMLVVFSILGLPALLVGSLEAFTQGHPQTGLLYLGFYLPVLYITIRRQSLSYRWKLGVLLGALYLMGFSNLLIYGFTGAGIHVLLTFCVLTTALRGIKGGLASMGLSLAAILGSGLAHTAGWVTMIPALLTIADSGPAWLTAGVTFLMLSMVMVGTAGLVQDVLQRSLRDLSQHQAQLAASEQQYRLLAETTTDLILTGNPEGRISYANSRTQAVTGFTQEELADRSVLSVISPENREYVEGQVERLLSAADQRVLFETSLVDRDGKEIPLEVNASPIRIQDEITGILMVGRDISKRKAAERALKRYSESLEEMVAERTRALEEMQQQAIRRERLAVLGRLAGGVAHELRNPLGVIHNAVYYLQNVKPLAPEILEEYLAILEDETGNATSIIGDLIDFSRKEQPDPEVLDFSQEVQDVLEELPPPEGVDVELQVPAQPPALYADPRHVSKIFSHLIANAYEAMPEGGTVTLAAEKAASSDLPDQDGETSYVRILCADTGMGIPRENLERIFEPLFTTKTRGIGLGLALTRRLVQANGGWLEVESEPGKGSRLVCYLPGSRPGDGNGVKKA